MIRHGKLERYEIDISVAARAVTLDGQVASEEQRTTAEEIAAQVKGISRVVNRLKCVPQTEPAELARQLFYWNMRWILFGF